MKKNELLKLASLGMAAWPLLSYCQTPSGAADRPNIVIIYADDLGYGSLNCYGADPELISTPHVNSMAGAGMLFTDAYVTSSVCSPTRYSLLTGSYPWRSDLKYGVVQIADPLLPDPEEPSLGAFLQNQGYQTAMVGKWHLGYGNKSRKKPEDYLGILRPGPLEMGFDYHYGVPHNHGDVLGVYIKNDRIEGLRSDTINPKAKNWAGRTYFGYDAPHRVDENVTATITEKATNWIRTQTAAEPFFLYFAPIAVHNPITPSVHMKGESNCGPYCDFIQDLDWSVGQILKTLDEMGLTENTLVIFTSDNGGVIPGGEIPIPADYIETLQRRADNNDLGAKNQLTIVEAAQAGLYINGALRGSKHTIYEGGTRIPFVAQWPGKIPQGSVSDAIICITDLFATFAEIVTGDLLGSDQTGPDSFSFLTVLTGSETTVSQLRESVVTANADGVLAIRRGEWKYIEGVYPAENTNPPRVRLDQTHKQLYNLASDLKESINLVEQHPNIAAKLQDELDKIRNAPAGRGKE
jgi:arylsulfatase A